MINLDVNLAGSSPASGTATPNSPLSLLSAQSFTTLLSEALSETLSKFGIDPNSIKLTVEDQPSQPSATGQTSVPSPAAASSQNSAATPAFDLPTTGAPGLGNPPPPPAPGTAPVSQHWYASTPADDAYWSKQPAAVRQLREIDNLDQRKQLGEQLASAGYSIDVPIMLWGWDAGKVTAARQSYGYTWVPSALQPQVSAAPGITGAGITPYNPNKPPSGSVQVA